MILRDEGETFLLITQPDHARLAEQIVAAVRTEPALESDRAAILMAVREHDNGWTEVDAEPTVEPGTGRPRDFISGPAPLKYEIWLRGITRSAKMNPRVGALIAEHALTVYGYRRGTPEWEPFFASITAMRDDLLEQIGASTGPPRELFERQYRCVHLGDSLSLQFCSGWKGPNATLEYEATLQNRVLLISPDPFNGATIALRVLGRRIPARRYQHDGDLREAVAAIAPEVLAGHARGVTR
jgi:hypothetical protein